MAANPSFYDPTAGDSGTLALTTSFQTIVTGAAGGSDIVALVATNTDNAANSQVTFAVESDIVIGMVNVPISSGQSINIPPIDCLDPASGLGGVEPNPYGGYVFHLKSGKILKAKMDNGGGDAIIYWRRKDY